MASQEIALAPWTFHATGLGRQMIAKAKLDRLDIKILHALQDDARLSSGDLAKRVSLTTSPCWRRVKHLEKIGVIRGYHAKLDVAKLGLGVTAFVFLSLEKVDTAKLDRFERAVVALPEILSCHRVSGHFDYQLLVAAEDLNAYGTYAKEYLNGLPFVKEVYTSFVLDEVKSQVSPPFPVG